MWANIISIAFSILVIVFIKKVFYKQSALHPWVFSFFIYYPVMIAFSYVLALAISEAGSIPSTGIGFASVWIALIVFRGGKSTRQMVDQYHEEKSKTKILKTKLKVEEKLTQLYQNDLSYQLPDFSAFLIPISDLSNAITSLLYIRQNSSEKSYILSLNYLFDTLSFFSSPQYDKNDFRQMDSYVISSGKKYFSGDHQWSRRSFRYVDLFRKDKDLTIGSHNITTLDEDT